MDLAKPRTLTMCTQWRQEIKVIDGIWKWNGRTAHRGIFKSPRLRERSRGSLDNKWHILEPNSNTADSKEDTQPCMKLKAQWSYIKQQQSHHQVFLIPRHRD